MHVPHRNLNGLKFAKAHNPHVTNHHLEISILTLCTAEQSQERLVDEDPEKMSEQQAQNEAEKNIEIWKVKKLIKRLEAARGNGTSMISLIIRE